MKFDRARHPRDGSRGYWEQSRDYVQKMFKMYGLETQLQCFNTTVAMEFEDEREVGTVSSGRAGLSLAYRNIFIFSRFVLSVAMEIYFRY